MTRTIAPPVSAVQQYLATGDYDPGFIGWPGANFVKAACKGDETLRHALIAEVRIRTAGLPLPKAVPIGDITAMTRTKVAPMVAGLFPAAEQPAVLVTLERSVIFLTTENIETVLLEERWLHTAWSLANLYLLSMATEPLSDDAPRIVGLSQETTCYVSLDYFDESDPFADYVVHEAAHIFHNCKRATVGLGQTRRREWLLDIDFSRRETFAYACEAYSRILELGRTTAQRRDALAQHADGALPGADSVDLDEYLDVLREAVEARNGWKRILQRCAPRKVARTESNTWASVRT